LSAKKETELMGKKAGGSQERNGSSPKEGESKKKGAFELIKHTGKKGGFRIPWAKNTRKKALGENRT